MKPVVINQKIIDVLYPYTDNFKFEFKSSSGTFEVTHLNSGKAKVYEGLSGMTSKEVEMLVNEIIKEIDKCQV